MRLSRLHIAGFKSFPDRAELGFDDGVTAIVGPNGCGKSNVVDAITWVLGEQSAKSLRGERMEDVIFNGSDARKPTAAAEVRLKFTDVTQVAVPAPGGDVDPLLDGQPVSTRNVEIGRRLYRSGESEYLIDGEICRLRDVHDLLMDSGLGVKAYAVIEQGKIGQILSSRPAERRTLIEEAAGVTKYKSRRRAAELKLEAAQQNLTRVDDIVFEVEKQRGALKRQAARARRYKKLREELRKWEQVQFARRFEVLSGEIEEADRRLADARVREVAAGAKVAELEAALEALRLGLTEAEAASTVARDEAHAMELAIGRLEQQIQFDRQQAEETARQRDVFRAEVEALDERRGPAAEAIVSQRATASDARAALEAARARVKAREAEFARAVAAAQEVEQTADATRAAVLAASATLAALSQARDHAAAVRDRVAAERERFEAEARDLEAEVARVEAAGDEAGRALEAARGELASAVGRTVTAEAALAERRANRDRIVQIVAGREKELAAVQARLQSLEELETRRATFGEAARFILAESDGAVRHHGAVADHLIVERSYERAVDALLGDLLQHVLVDRSDDASAALALVSERHAGRCGFVVLDEIGGGGDVAPIVVPSGARALADVVRGRGPHGERVSRLIGQALVVDSFESAQALARTVSMPVATTAGEIFHAAWRVEGGAHRGTHGILETRAEAEALREDVAASTEAIERALASLADADRDLAEAQANAGGAIRAEHDQEKAIVGLDALVTRAAEERARVARRLELVTSERGRAAAEQSGTEARRDEAIAAILTHETQMRGAEESLGSVLARLQGARESADGALRLVTEMRTEEATLIERASGFDAELARLEAAAADLAERIAARHGEIARLDQRSADLAASNDVNTRAFDESARALETLRVALRDGDNRLNVLRIDFGERDHAIRGARQALDAVKAELLQSEVARATASSDLAHLATTCFEAVGVPLADISAAVARLREAGELVAPALRTSAAVAEDEEGDGLEPGSTEGEPVEGFAETAGADVDGEIDPDAVVALVRQRIDKLGPVNMMAIEQFDELDTRHLFLTTQRKDLLDSIAQTGEAIRKIDRTTRERFADAFQEINRHFEQTFTTLFGGGRAGLVLINQENDQESGIDIIAQPPGKRLQNVQLLSGGEKALTAMALMFAIFKHRPSPFCLLDEIDAPLDDANIGRFIEMLQGMQDHTQFILVTHHRKTMEIANRLYGVTMEEPGVSKLISLQLN